MSGWFIAPRVGWRKWGPPTVKALGRTTNFSKRTDDTLIDTGRLVKRCAIKTWALLNLLHTDITHIIDT